MPRSSRKKTTEQSTKSTSSRRKKATVIEEQPAEQVTTPLADATNLLQNPPAITPRHIDFSAPLKDEAVKDEWASDSDDSFEEKITWSRHRMRVTPGGFTPRNIQEVRRRLNLMELPEDNPSPIPASKISIAEAPARPARTPMKSYISTDPSILPPSPSPKKATPLYTPSKPAKTPSTTAKEVVKGNPSITTSRGKVVRPSSPIRPASPTRMTITQVKEFKFASEARIRRSPEKLQTAQKGKAGHSPTKVAGHKSAVVVEKDGERKMEEGEIVRMRARETGKASILAWGETRGRYLDD